ncbi:MAG TPA: flagellar basal body P-ring protein FlgI, partial [Mycoplana sp.]|nr:flagellar basal body P-ring protein FlgI [Mycoplana sp.]
SNGVTAVEPNTDIVAQQDGGTVAILNGSNLRTLVSGLNSIGVKPDGIISILQGIKSAGALQAELVLQLRNPDFSTAVGMADAINRFATARFGGQIAEARDSQAVYVAKPKRADLARLMADIENLVIETDVPARVVINERTGTIVIGQDVRIAEVAVSYGTLTVQVTEMPQVVQPAPFSDGVTAVEPNTDIVAQQDGGTVAILNGSNLRTLVSGLNSIGVKPDGIISILQGIKSAGALQAELVLQ